MENYMKYNIDFHMYKAIIFMIVFNFWFFMFFYKFTSNLDWTMEKSLYMLDFISLELIFKNKFIM